MVAFDLARIAFRRKDDLFVLIGALLHREFEGAHRLGAAVEFVRVAQCHELRLMIVQPAQADPLARMPGGQLVAHEHGGGREFRLLVEQQQQIEGRSEQRHLARLLIRAAAFEVVPGNVGRDHRG